MLNKLGVGDFGRVAGVSVDVSRGFGEAWFSWRWDFLKRFFKKFSAYNCL